MSQENKRSSARRQTKAPFGSRTDVGCAREHNEDSLAVSPPLFIVADGMGGHAAGEVASEIAIRVISENAPEHPDAEQLGNAIEKANLAILEAAASGEGKEGMGTTVTAVMLEGERLVIAQIGDSRAYLLHQEELQQLTRDHSLVADLVEAGQITEEEARTHPQRSVITRALGSSIDTTPDLYEINVESGDRLLLCSDGLTSMVIDDEIKRILTNTYDPQQCAAQLVNEAIAQGGYDNVTVVVADVTGLAEKKHRKVVRKTILTIVFIVFLFAALLAAAGYAFHYVTSNAAYLADNNGKVAVYRGVYGSLFGMSFSNLEYTTDVDVDSLSPGAVSRLKEGGIAVDNMDAAASLVDEYRQIAEQNKQAAENNSAEEQPTETAQAPTQEEEQSTQEGEPPAQDTSEANEVPLEQNGEEGL